MKRLLVGAVVMLSAMPALAQSPGGRRAASAAHARSGPAAGRPAHQGSRPCQPVIVVPAVPGALVPTNVPPSGSGIGSMQQSGVGMMERSGVGAMERSGVGSMERSGIGSFGSNGIGVLPSPVPSAIPTPSPWSGPGPAWSARATLPRGPFAPAWSPADCH